MKNVRTLTITALLIAFAIIIPIQFGFLKVVVFSFTATLASHVPMFLSMLLGPGPAALVGIGSTIGFSMTGLPLPVVARASMHIIVGLVGGFLIKKGVSYPKVVAITAPIHGLLEALVIIPVLGIATATVQSPIVGIGTVAHHTVDGIIAYALIKALMRTGTSIFEGYKKAA